MSVFYFLGFQPIKFENWHNDNNNKDFIGKKNTLRQHILIKQFHRVPIVASFVTPALPLKAKKKFKLH